MNDNFYSDFLTSVPVDQVNAWVVRHGYQPADPSKISKQQMAQAIKAIVHQHGKGAYNELVGIKEQIGQNKVKSALVEMEQTVNPPVVEEKATYGCDGSGNPSSKGCGCGCKSGNKLSADGDTTSSAKSFSFTDFLNKNGAWVVVGATAVAITLIIKLTK